MLNRHQPRPPPLAHSLVESRIEKGTIRSEKIWGIPGLGHRPLRSRQEPMPQHGCGRRGPQGPVRCHDRRGAPSDRQESRQGPLGKAPQTLEMSLSLEVLV